MSSASWLQQARRHETAAAHLHPTGPHATHGHVVWASSWRLCCHTCSNVALPGVVDEAQNRPCRYLLYLLWRLLIATPVWLENTARLPCSHCFCRIVKHDEGHYTVSYKSPDGPEQCMEVGLVMMATGRSPRAQGLGLEVRLKYLVNACPCPCYNHVFSCGFIWRVARQLLCCCGAALLRIPRSADDLACCGTAAVLQPA